MGRRRLSYHRGSHYNSVVDTRRSAVGAGLGLPGFKLGQMDAASKVRDAMGAREEATLEHALLLEAQMASDAAETQAAIEREVMKVSRRIENGGGDHANVPSFWLGGANDMLRACGWLYVGRELDLVYSE